MTTIWLWGTMQEQYGVGLEYLNRQILYCLGRIEARALYSVSF